MSAGTLYGVGVGPGDPELLTLKAHRLIRSTPVVYVPVTRPHARSLARAIAERYLDPAGQTIIELVFAMRATSEERELQWRRNAATIVRTLDAEQDALFLTEGDPMFYSTYLHIARVLHGTRPDLTLVAVPGISSPYAAAALTDTPLGDGNERLAVVPATDEDASLRDIFQSFQTVVLLKVSTVMDRVIDLLEEMGLVECAIYVRRCGQPEQEIVRDIRALRGQSLDYFSLVLVRRT